MSTELPDSRGYFGEFGGRFAPEVMMQLVLDLEQAWSRFRSDGGFREELSDLLQAQGGRQTPLYFAEKLSREAGGASIYFKREDLTSTGSHHINSALGQGLIAKKLGLSLLIAETSTGMHGLAAAHAAKALDLECEIFIGAADASCQPARVTEMEQLGARISIVEPARASLLEANEAAHRALVGAMSKAYLVFSSIVGPHPIPRITREFQSVIGQEVLQQTQASCGKLPTQLVSYAAGGSLAMGLFHPFLDSTVSMAAVESSGREGEQKTRPEENRVGIYQGAKTLMRRDEHGLVVPNISHATALQASIAGPEYCHYVSTGRISCTGISDQQALAASQLTHEQESINPSPESAHAIAAGLTLASGMTTDEIVVIALSGRPAENAPASNGIEA